MEEIQTETNHNVVQQILIIFSLNEILYKKINCHRNLYKNKKILDKCRTSP